jgi:hypothetical protein
LPVANEEVSSYTVDLYDDGTPYIHIWVKWQTISKVSH